MSKPKIELYQAEWCSYCHRVKKVLEELGISYLLIKVPFVKGMRKELFEVSGQKGIPTLIDGDVVIADDDDAIIGHLKNQYGDPQKVKG